MKRHHRRAACLSLTLGLALAACSSGAPAAHSAGPAGRWEPFLHVPGVVDLAGPHVDGSFTGGCRRAPVRPEPGRRPQAVRPGAGRLLDRDGPKLYITLAGNGRVAGTGCSFSNGTIFALQPGKRPGVILIGADGRARRFVSLPAPVAPDGITFDSAGHFGHKLIVTARNHSGTSVLAIDCAGGIRTITTHAPVVEGGITVAPASFGRYGGDLVAPNELTGQVFAIGPDGTVVTLASSGLPHGGDIGVESTGFVPPGFGARDSAYLADRFSKGNRHPGTDSVLRLPGSELLKAGVRPGDLLVATEGSARTIVVRCATSCTVKYIAIGPVIAHAEGHIVFAVPG